ncbi:MAG: WecB/TagA/CpsF family glycosyltransferase [Deltaproteobacteria bacterium]|nr:WecB/TagA/CpsF family glycosyltransferase [Deltaproteobacteria bacterium]
MSRVDVDGLIFDDVTMTEATARVVELAKMRDRPRYVCTGNLDHLAIAATDHEFRDAYLNADLVVADGAPVVWLSKLGGTPLKERVAGSDLFWTLGRASAESGITLFFLGGVEGAADKAKAVLEERYPGVKIVGTYCPPFATFATDEEQDRIRDVVKAANPDVLLVAFGAPKQEKWIAKHKDRLGVPVSIGVGGSFEMAAGILKRAPVWMQKVGLEWAFRFAQQPRRLFDRYIVRDMPHLAKAAAKTAAKRVGLR